MRIQFKNFDAHSHTMEQAFPESAIYMAAGVIHLPVFPFPAEVETHRGHQRLSFLLIMMREMIEGCAKLLTATRTLGWYSTIYNDPNFGSTVFSGLLLFRVDPELIPDVQSIRFIK